MVINYGFFFLSSVGRIHLQFRYGNFQFFIFQRVFGYPLEILKFSFFYKIEVFRYGKVLNYQTNNQHSRTIVNKPTTFNFKNQPTSCLISPSPPLATPPLAAMMVMLSLLGADLLVVRTTVPIDATTVMVLAMDPAADLVMPPTTSVAI